MPLPNLAAPDSAAYRLATQWLYDRINYEKLARPGSHYRFTLDRMRDLVARIGLARYLAGQPDPAARTSFAEPSQFQKVADGLPQAKIVHIAGTKGKGSVATMTATMLAAQGYQVGLYTSPHLVDLEERFRVNGKPAARAEMMALIDFMRPVVEQMSRDKIGGPSFFELTTAIAIEHFHRNACDFWVLETGLGGRLDSTNVFQSDVTLITSIGLDHQHVLGDTVELIAKEKAGIFKPGVPAISGVTKPPARDVIRQAAADIGAPLLELERDFEIKQSSGDAMATGHDDWGSSFDLVRGSSTLNRPTSSTPVRLLLEGRHQTRNASLAVMGLDRLGIPASPVALDALAILQIDARLERFCLPTGTTVILDAAHNPDSIAALVATLQVRFSNKPVTGVFGTSVDKDAAVMLASLQPHLHHLVLTRYHGNPRFTPLETLSTFAQQAGFQQRDSSPSSCYSQQEDPITACTEAIEIAGQAGVVVICGSFFLAAEVRPWLRDRTFLAPRAPE
jgi:dihydrofolate synthase/folylpolyglutamate synthase